MLLSAAVNHVLSGGLKDWVAALQNFVARNIRTFAYANNHYAGHAPATANLFHPHNS
jgi:uncharacterized protein YecE (DUF72 family)